MKKSARWIAVVAVGMLGLAAAGCSGVVSDGTADTLPPTPTAAARSIAPACTTAGDQTVAYKHLDGGDADLTSIDVYNPHHACGAPVVMWVHGGGYHIGDKARQVDDKVRLFTDQGWIFVSVNYRLTKANPDAPGSAHFPDHYDDVADAVAWVHANAGSIGGDPARIALLGHSAGADIVSNVTVNPTYLAAHGLELADIRCAGPLDTEGFDKVAAGGDDPDGEDRQWSTSLGNNPNYLTETSATRLVASALGIPPTIGVVRGTTQRQQIETAYLDALGRAGVATTTIDARSLTHIEVSQRIGAAGDDVMTPPLLAFLSECFA